MSVGIVSVAAITAICHLVGDFVKASGLNDKWIPVIVGTAGALLGMAGLLIGMPEFPATDLLTAAAIGTASGFAATGVHQAGKQLTKGVE